MSIKRYTLFATIDTPESGPLVAPKLNVIGQADGEWVKYEDHVAEVERLQGDIRAYHEGQLEVQRERDEARNEHDRQVSAWRSAHREQNRLTVENGALARDLAAARSERDEARAQADGLARALKQALLFAETRRDEVLWFVQENRTARDLGQGDAFMEMCRYLSGVLAALPTPPEEADRAE